MVEGRGGGGGGDKVWAVDDCKVDYPKHFFERKV